jgi:hypothetical protein
MELDGAFGVLALLLHWRVVLCLLISSVLAFLLVHFFPWFTGLQGLVFAVLGLLPGAIWEDPANSSPSATHSTSTSVAVLAAIIFAAVWGAVSSTSVHSAFAGMAVFAAGAWGWFRYAVASKRWLSREQGILCTVAATVAYPISALLAHNAV